MGAITDEDGHEGRGSKKNGDANDKLHSLFCPLPVPCPAAVYCLPKVGCMLLALSEVEEVQWR